MDEKELTNQRLQELVQDLQLGDRLKKLLQDLSLQNLPIGTVRELRKSVKESIRYYLQDSGSNLIQEVTESADWEKFPFFY